MPQELHLRLPPDAEPNADTHRAALTAAAARRLGVRPERIGHVQVQRVSFDARRRHRDWQVRTTVFLAGEPIPPGPRTSPPTLPRAAADAPRVVVVGSGPAGMFCALDLAAGGLRVCLLERGGDVRARRRPLAQLHRGAGVDPDSNYCFGEGGAGTYSDGKLYTRSGNKRAVRGVLEEVVAHGARQDILTSWRPHVGSNKLPEVVRALRETLLQAGVEVCFHTRVEELRVDPRGPDGAQVTGVRARQLAVPGQPVQEWQADAVVLATGHSARDSLELAARAGAHLEAKGFALGVRAEHPQSWLDEHQYGGLRTTCDLPPAFYELVEQADGRGVYSFCMCPGGWIVPATTAEGRVVVNGMSLSRRDSPFANSGIVVQLEPEDWCGERGRALGFDDLVGGVPALPGDDPLFGVRVQEALETRCARAGGGRSRVPGQQVARFARGASAGDALPTSYRPGAVPVDLGALLPSGVTDRLREGLQAFDARLPGFAGEGGMLLAPESRTSSPVRMARDDESLEARHRNGGLLSGLYPSGEGGGFAGGIVSAAIDGRRVAERVLERLAVR